MLVHTRRIQAVAYVASLTFIAVAPAEGQYSAGTSTVRDRRLPRLEYTHFDATLPAASIAALMPREIADDGTRALAALDHASSGGRSSSMRSTRFQHDEKVSAG